MFLDGEAVLYIVNKATKCFVATFLDGPSAMFRQSVEEMWLMSVMSLSLVCSGYSHMMRTNRGSVFAFNWWKT